MPCSTARRRSLQQTSSSSASSTSFSGYDLTVSGLLALEYDVGLTRDTNP